MPVKSDIFAFRDLVIGPLSHNGLLSVVVSDGNVDGFTTLEGALDSPLNPGEKGLYLPIEINCG